jgi:catalase
VGTFWRKVLTEEERERLVRNIAGHLKDASEFIQRRALRNFFQVDKDYGERIAVLLRQHKVCGLS